MKKSAKVGLAAVAALSPLLAFAAEVGDFFDLVGVLNNIVDTLLPFVVGLAVLVILWGVFNYIAGAGDEEKRAQAKQYVIWGIIGLFVMVSVWGLVNILAGTFELNEEPPEFIPGALDLPQN